MTDLERLGFEYPKVSELEKKKRLQKFYDEWVKPMKDFMSPKMLLDMEKFIEDYSLIK